MIVISFVLYFVVTHNYNSTFHEPRPYWENLWQDVVGSDFTQRLKKLETRLDAPDYVEAFKDLLHVSQDLEAAFEQFKAGVDGQSKDTDAVVTVVGLYREAILRYKKIEPFIFSTGNDTASLWMLHSQYAKARRMKNAYPTFAEKAAELEKSVSPKVLSLFKAYESVSWAVGNFYRQRHELLEAFQKSQELLTSQKLAELETRVIRQLLTERYNAQVRKMMD